MVKKRAERLTPCDDPIVLLARTCRGNWIARSPSGAFGGVFLRRGHAVKYALEKNGHRPESILEVSYSELDNSGGSTETG